MLKMPLKISRKNVLEMCLKWLDAISLGKLEV